MDCAAFSCYSRVEANDVLFFYYVFSRSRKSVDKLLKFPENILWRFKTSNIFCAFDARSFYVAPFITSHKPNENLLDLRNIATSKQQNSLRWRVVRSETATGCGGGNVCVNIRTDYYHSHVQSERWWQLAERSASGLLRNHSVISLSESLLLSLNHRSRLSASM